MSQNIFLKCACDRCGGHIEFPADGIGSTIACPHCGADTELVLEVPAVLATRSSRGLKWFVIGALILLVGAVAAVAILIATQRVMEKRRAARNSARIQSVNNVVRIPIKSEQARPVRVVLTNGFSTAVVNIEKTAGGALAYATGSLKNETDGQRFGVTVEIDLLDPRGTKVGTTKDYATVIEPRAEWKFRALITPKNVAAARVAEVKEQQ